MKTVPVATVAATKHNALCVCFADLSFFIEKKNPIFFSDVSFHIQSFDCLFIVLLVIASDGKASQEFANTHYDTWKYLCFLPAKNFDHCFVCFLSFISIDIKWVRSNGMPEKGAYVSLKSKSTHRGRWIAWTNCLKKKYRLVCGDLVKIKARSTTQIDVCGLTIVFCRHRRFCSTVRNKSSLSLLPFILSTFRRRRKNETVIFSNNLNPSYALRMFYDNQNDNVASVAAAAHISLERHFRM